MTPVRVLYLAGSGRSGSTLVTTILGQLDGVFAAGELRYLWRRGVLDDRPCGCGLPFRRCPFWTGVLAGLPAAGAGPIADRLRGRLRLRGLPRLLHRHGRGRPVLDRHPDDAAIARLYAAIAAALPGTGGPEPATGRANRPGTARRAGPVIVDSSKLPPYGALLGTLPGIDLRVLHLVRDPRATAFSWRRRRRLDGPPPGTGTAAGDGRLMSRPAAWKATLLWLVWNAATERLWGRHRPERYLRVRYEDFVAAPAETIRRIARFAGVEPADLPFTGPGVVRLAPTHSVAGNPARHRTGAVPVVADTEWVGGLSRRAYLLVTALALPALRRFDYPLRRPAPPAGPDPRTTPEEG